MESGRVLSWAEYGDPTGIPVVYVHGTPGSHLEPQWIFSTSPVLLTGLRLIAPDRPGYGATPPTKFWPSAWVDDVRFLLARLGIERFGVIAFSGGSLAAYALASDPHVVNRLVILAGFCTDERSAFARQLPLKLRFSSLLAVFFPRMLAPWYIGRARFACWQLGSSRSRHISASGDVIDRLVQTSPEMRASLSNDVRESILHQKAAGLISDLVQFRNGPAPRLAGVTVPTLLIHGLDDRNVPVRHSLVASSKLAASEVVLVPGGHRAVITRLDEARRWLAAI